MTAKLLRSVLFAVVAATSAVAFAQNMPADSHDQASSTFPSSPVGNPFIE